MHPKTLATLLLAALTASSTLARADEAKKKINYKDDITPILQSHCFACHNNDKKKGGLILDSYATMMQGGGSGTVIEPGDAENSRLYLLIAHEEEPNMPPNGPKIPDAEIDLIKKWISEGAPETSGSVVVMKEKPKLDFKVDPALAGKPQGEPAMPAGVSTEPLVVTSRPHAINAMAASPWAPLVAIAQHKQVVLYNTETRQLAAVLPFPEGSIATLKFSRDGDLLLAGGGRGGQSGRVVVWNVKTGERLFEVGKEYDTVLAADISPDRSLVALGGPSKVLRVYNTSDGELVYENKKHTEWVTAIAFSPDGVLLASGDRNGGLVVWEALTGREFYDLRDHKAMITDVDWRLDSNVLASASEDGTIKLWEMQQGKAIKSVKAHAGGVESVRFSKSGRLVSTGRDRTPRIWKPDGGAERALEAFGDVALSAVFTFDESAVIAGDFTGEVRIFEAKEGKRIGDLIANPEPLAVRLEKTNQALAAAQTQADAATKALADLQAKAKASTAAVVQAEKALKAAQDAQAADTKAVAAKTPEVQALASKVETLKAEADALAAEQKRHAAEEPTRAASLTP